MGELLLGRLGNIGPLAAFLNGVPPSFRVFINPSGSAWLLPESPRSVPGALEVFAPAGRSARLLWGGWGLGLPLGGRVGLSPECLEGLARSVGLESNPTGAVLYVGTPGAYRKALVGLWVNGVARAVVKIALVPFADDAVRLESRMLLRFGTHLALEERVPRLLGTGVWHGRVFHVMAPIQGIPGPAKLSREHFDWCGKLFHLERQEYAWDESPFREQLDRLVPRVAGIDSTASVLWRGMELTSKRLSHRRLSFGWAHRDFAPWNTRLLRNRLVIFDWEMAKPDRPPGYDLLHFHVIQAALRSGLVRLPWGQLKAWLAQVAPDWSGLERELYLLYLIDQTTFYGESRILVPEMGEQGVLRWLIAEVRRVLGEIA